MDGWSTSFLLGWPILKEHDGFGKGSDEFFHLFEIFVLDILVDLMEFFTPKLGEMIHFDFCIFFRYFNQQLVYLFIYAYISTYIYNILYI